jgi:hypothetical protein
MAKRLSSTLLPTVSTGPTPTLLRGRYVDALVRQVNRNTSELRAPELTESPNEDELSRQTAQGNLGDIVDSDDGSGQESSATISEWVENYRTTSQVTVTDPDNPDFSLTVDRIDTVGFVLPDGSITELQFDNG